LQRIIDRSRADLLVVLSTTTSYFASLVMLILDVRSNASQMSVGTYFDSSVFLIMFILLGRTLESYAKSRTTDSVVLLGQLRPETALLVESGKIEPEGEVNMGNPPPTATGSDPAAFPSHPVPVDHLEIGDLILIPPGSLPPTDGRIVRGKTTLDESSLTGESRPVAKGPGDEVLTGTLNLTSAITIRVTSLGDATTLEKIISAVSDASSRKAPIEKMAERLTGVFVPIIIYLALLVLVVWLSIALTGHLISDRPGGRVFMALEFAIATLVVACPCGIGLAVPCANAVGTGLAAKSGILAVGGGEAFMGAKRVTMVVLDKTGTLTEGKSRLTDQVVLDSGKTLLRAIIEVERGSTHPLAQGLVESLDNEKRDGGVQVDVMSSKETPGRGLEARVKVDAEEHELLIGNALLLTDNGVILDDAATQRIAVWSGEAKSVILIGSRPSSCESEAAESAFQLAAMFALSDPPRETSPSVISTLKALGIRVMMLSGDNEGTAKAVGTAVGIDVGDIKAGVGPEEKADVIRDIQKQSTAKAATTGNAWWKRKVADRVMFVGGEQFCS
jgi:heavy metal translocating P-type ATPase